MTIEIVTDEIAGVKKGASMTFTQADSGNVNPDYVSHTATAGNCPACVLCLKARLEGFNVQAKPYDETNEIMFQVSENTNFGLIDKNTGVFPKYIKPKEKYMPRLLSWFTNFLENDVFYSIEFYWKDLTPDGHIMVIFKNQDQLFMYDPQTNELLQTNRIRNFLYRVRLGTIKLLNLSNCFLNKAVVDYMLEARK